eukprot:1473142-Rhodomonas_salina.1
MDYMSGPTGKGISQTAGDVGHLLKNMEAQANIKNIVRLAYKTKSGSRARMTETAEEGSAIEQDQKVIEARSRSMKRKIEEYKKMLIPELESMSEAIVFAAKLSFPCGTFFDQLVRDVALPVQHREYVWILRLLEAHLAICRILGTKGEGYERRLEVPCKTQTSDR